MPDEPGDVERPGAPATVLIDWARARALDRPKGLAITTGFLIWVVVAFFAAACWGAVVVLNKKVLDAVRPVPVNFFALSVSTLTLTLVAVPLSLLHLWPLDFSMTWSAAGYISISAAVTWLVAFNAYYYALRSGRVGVVGPLCSTDPLFTAVFAAALVGTALGHLTIAGLLVTIVGVILISRFMDDEPEPHAPALEGSPVALSDDAAATAPAHRAGAVVVLSLVTAAGWGLAPVLIQLAERSTGGASTTMMVLGEALGVVMLAPFVLRRQASLFVAEPVPGGRRRAIALLVAAGVLSAVFAVLFYVLIEQIGPVLMTVIIATSPVFAIAGGVVFLREHLSGHLVAGIAVTLLGVALATLPRLV